MGKPRKKIQYQLVQILALVGQSFGRKADIRSRNSDGKCKYSFDVSPCIRTLKEVKIVQKIDGPWLFWYWEPAFKGDCGYSGVRLTVNDCQNLNYFLKIAID